MKLFLDYLIESHKKRVTDTYAIFPKLWQEVSGFITAKKTVICRFETFSKNTHQTGVE